jgi:hypothetical protein
MRPHGAPIPLQAQSSNGLIDSGARLGSNEKLRLRSGMSINLEPGDCLERFGGIGVIDAGGLRNRPMVTYSVAGSIK